MNINYNEESNFDINVNLNDENVNVNIKMEEDAFNTKFIVLKGEKGEKGSTDYSELTNKPKINDVEINGNLTSDDLNLQPKGNYADERVTNLEIDSLFI